MALSARQDRIRPSYLYLRICLNLLYQIRPKNFFGWAMGPPLNQIENLNFVTETFLMLQSQTKKNILFCDGLGNMKWAENMKWVKDSVARKSARGISSRISEFSSIPLFLIVLTKWSVRELKISLTERAVVSLDGHYIVRGWMAERSYSFWITLTLNTQICWKQWNFLKHVFTTKNH